MQIGFSANDLLRSVVCDLLPQRIAFIVWSNTLE